ncbi:hypothetical protein P7K49_018855 [Saguinus oedipus]|uniref:Uncharacterized protein n=1 Tax=Saguinus oedipus TaxID=9490 RepID=A0ABQ9V6J8_SAGOE|nr:hypothetical protein P7K49_018855 [Saguinus oedipus]
MREHNRPRSPKVTLDLEFQHMQMSSLRTKNTAADNRACDIQTAPQDTGGSLAAGGAQHPQKTGAAQGQGQVESKGCFPVRVCGSSASKAFSRESLCIDGSLTTTEASGLVKFITKKKKTKHSRMPLRTASLMEAEDVTGG